MTTHLECSSPSGGRFSGFRKKVPAPPITTVAPVVVQLTPDIAVRINIGCR